MIIDALDVMDEQILTRITGVGRQVMNDGTVRYDKVWLMAEKNACCLSVNIDTDTLLIKPSPLDQIGGEDISGLETFVGKPWGWYWMCENSQGYKDMLIISGNHIDPRLAFVAVASSLKISQLVSL